MSCGSHHAQESEARPEQNPDEHERLMNVGRD